MFTSIMRVLHEMLPCSRNFFSMKRKYRMMQASDHDRSPESRKIREIASPRLVRGLSLGKSPSRRISSRGCSTSSQNGGLTNRFSAMALKESPNVRVKKNVNPEHVRNSSRQNKALSTSNPGNFLPELNDASSREDIRTPSGFGSPKKLNMQTKIRNKTGAGNDTNGCVTFNELDSNQGSPITPSKAFAVRNFKKDERQSL